MLSKEDETGTKLILTHSFSRKFLFVFANLGLLIHRLLSGSYTPQLTSSSIPRGHAPTSLPHSHPFSGSSTQELTSSSTSLRAMHPPAHLFHDLPGPMHPPSLLLPPPPSGSYTPQFTSPSTSLGVVHPLPPSRYIFIHH